ncbi:hypothetical protein E0H75_35950 [Kribbella capetownensis]|uniref:Uncharacterized protein n=1 Tax=Kribbella capetownensis TaxID=1572659 RepID=A0A4R0JDW2_9ACTN|nr:hypothetical protein [Kribbella capetownensis]TCC44247.1 hypothetical protein E0H75_35950 [Kribbella capetownensis]
MRRIGGGWGPFVALHEARYAPYGGTHYRTNEYGLRNDGVLSRWTATDVDDADQQDATYDTFLADLKGGSLYTIRIPTSAPMKPVVKLVRASTWHGFEAMVAEKCGTQSTLLVGIDKDTGSAYLDAVSHAQGTSTVIRSLRTIPGTFNAPVYFRWATLDFDELSGE